MSTFAHAPSAGHPVPSMMRELADGPVTLVWRNEVGGLTGRVETDPPRYLKWNPAGSGESLAAEAERLRWIQGAHPVPEVIDLIVAHDAELLVTRAVAGRSAVDPRWAAQSGAAVRAIAEGLRALHSLPTMSCPFDWGVGTRIGAAAEAGLSAPRHLADAPAIDRLVICHGDACAPNTLLSDDGRFAGNVDLGRLGLADRWADLAIATMSLSWDYEEYDEAEFWDAYGIEPDQERIGYYRALWNAT